MGFNTTAEERQVERDRFIWIYNNCQDRVGLHGTPEDENKHPWREEPRDSAETRALNEKDVKVTVKYSDNPQNDELAHLKPIEGQKYYTLGIHFKKWSRISPEEKLSSLVHEVAHSRYNDHRSAYWKFVLQIWESMFKNKREWIDWFSGDVERNSKPSYLSTPIDIEYLKNRILNDIYTNAHPDIKKEILEEAEEVLEYKFSFVKALDFPRTLRGDRVFPNVDNWDGEPENVKIRDLDFPSRICDENLVKRLNNIERTCQGFNAREMPPIKGYKNEQGLIEITENKLDAALISRVQYPEDQIPVILD